MSQLSNYFATGIYDATANGKDLGLQANFMEIWSPVIQTSFEIMNKMEGLYQKKNISNGNSLKVPVLAEGTVAFVQTGGEIPEEDVESGSVNVFITDALTGSVTINDDDKAAISYSFIETKVKNVAKQMARLHQTQVCLYMTKAARGERNSGDINVVEGATANTPIEISGYNAMTISNKGVALAGALYKAAEMLDFKDVKEDRYFVCDPSVYYALANNLDAINKFYGGQGSFAEGTIVKVAGINIHKTNFYGKNPVDGKGNTVDTAENFGVAGTDKSLGVVITDEAVVNVELLGLKIEELRMPNKRKTVQYLSKAVGYGVLRNDVAIEIKEAV